jgi:anti-sigma-K factor RskA
MYAGVPLDRRVRVEQRLAQLVDAMNQSSRDAADERRVAAPAVRVAVLVEARLDEEARLAEAADDLVGGLDVESPCSQP